jgi:hypothetical protein
MPQAAKGKRNMPFLPIYVPLTLKDGGIEVTDLPSGEKS